MSEELKPCPFCGSTDIETFYNKTGVDHLTCQYCGAAAKDWNTRHEPGELPQWAIDAIEKEIFGLWEEYAKTGITRLDACARKLEWVLSLRKTEEKE